MPQTQTSRHGGTEREDIFEGPNPLGLVGVEFIEYTTSKPQSLGNVLETMGFRPIARHRSREVLLYRQGGLNIIVNAHGNGGVVTEKPQIAAIALESGRLVLQKPASELLADPNIERLFLGGAHGAAAATSDLSAVV